MDPLKPNENHILKYGWIEKEQQRKFKEPCHTVFRKFPEECWSTNPKINHLVTILMHNMEATAQSRQTTHEMLSNKALSEKKKKELFKKGMKRIKSLFAACLEIQQEIGSLKGKAPHVPSYLGSDVMVEYT